MSLLKNIFSKSNPDTRLAEGDVFYTVTGSSYNIFKLLKIDTFDTYHVVCYEPVTILPDPINTEALLVQVYHAPFSKDAFKDATVLQKTLVTADDLLGYHEYLRRTQHVAVVTEIANGYYQRAYTLTDEKKHAEAINEYSKAIDLVPEFFQAIDNRAFCKMDLGRWKDAILDFEMSLSVQPGNFIAVFSIGECYYKLGNGLKAKEQFEKAIVIAPEHPAPKEFLKKAEELIASHS